MAGIINSTDKLFCTSEAKKLKGKYCCAYGCTEKPVAKKGGLCHRHYARKIRILDPVQMRYNQLRCNAKRRGKEVGITIQEFRDFCQETGYCIVKGRRGMNATLDRIINRKGYVPGNLQLLTNRQNASKGASDQDDCPF